MSLMPSTRSRTRACRPATRYLAPLLVAASFLSAAPRSADAHSDAAYQRIGNAITTSFAEMAKAPSSKTPKDLLVRAYRVMRVMDPAAERFLVPSMEASRAALLADLDPSAFVGQVTSCAKRNPYLNEFMDWVDGKGSTWELDAAKDNAERWRVVSEATAYAAVLDRMTRLVRNNPRVLKELIGHFNAVRADPAFKETYSNVFDWFLKIKVYSVDEPMRYFDQYHDKRAADPAFALPPESGRFALSANIAEATLKDVTLGNWDNARAGWILTWHRVGGEDDPRTGAAHSRWSPDGMGIQYHAPLPKKWADLYSTWNMAFVTHLPEWPYIMAKLFAPQVLCYAATETEPMPPSEYMYNRLVALYLHLQYMMFDRVARQQRNDQGNRVPLYEASWLDPSVTEMRKAWGEVNKKNAQQYKLDVRCVGRSKAKPYEASRAEELRQESETLREIQDLNVYEPGAQNIPATRELGDLVASAQAQDNPQSWMGWIWEKLTGPACP